MNYSVIDIETDGLIDDEGEVKKAATKIHCLSVNQFHDGHWTAFTLIDYKDMAEFLQKEECLVCHNIIRFDVPMLEKMLGVTVKSRKIDTLGLSWYLYPERKKHGLEQWGVDLGVEKPMIADWQNLTIEEYIYRCEQDVKINTELFLLQKKYLLEIYGTWDKASRIIGYLSYKLECAREQQEVKWRVDIDRAKRNLDKLSAEKLAKKEVLSQLMPPNILYKVAKRPKQIFTKNGTPSHYGKKWLDLLIESGLPEHHVGTIRVKTGQEPGNPSSHEQLKAWLFSLGWKPDYYKPVKQADGSIKKIPQIGHEEGNGELSESVEELIEIVPELEHLKGYFVLQHRIGILKSFLECADSEGFIKSEISGFTNTLRFQHKKPIANLPQIPKLYWEEIRECLVYPREGYILCGSDMSGLEDNTKQHYMWRYDQEYVKQMRTPGWDPHIDIAVLSKAISYDEGEFYKWYDKKGKYEYIPTTVKPTENHVLDTAMDFNTLINLPKEEQSKIAKKLKGVRLKSKKVNFAGVYGAGAPRLAETAHISVKEAKELHTTYWMRNKAVKQIARDCWVKKVGGAMWLFNPVSQFYYSLRADKDRFSTLNQGTGVYCFDTWIRHVRKQGIKICCQYHDEIVFPLKAEEKDICSQKLDNAIVWTNEELKLNVPLAISKDFGLSYAEIH